MFKQKKLHCAVLTAITALTSSETANADIEEIIVTATKRAESSQDVPISVQTMGEQALDEQNIGNFEDYLRLLPSVVAAGRGPGQNNVYIRGVANDSVAVAVSEISGSTPSVALYQDEQPISAGGRNLDFYVTDIERIEVLAGPQGTLFGASSQSGTVRLITNKPKFNDLEAGFDASLSTTKHGEMSNSAEAYINVPIVSDKLAARAAVYSVNNGGYIDNIDGNLTIPASNPAFPAGAILTTVSNSEIVENDFNDSSYAGGRVGIKYAFNDDWNLLVQHTEQELVVDGVFDHNPEDVGVLKVRRFFADELVDDASLTTWTVEGRLGALEIIYTGGYLDRESDQIHDYAGYLNVGGFVPYYVCDYPAYTNCADPSYGIYINVLNTRKTHEFRVTTPFENRWRAVAGVFLDDSQLIVDGGAIQPGVVGRGFPLNAPHSQSTISNPEPRPAGVTFFNDVVRDDEQIAGFGEVSFDIVPDRLTVTGGIRYYDLDVGLAGSVNFAGRGAVDGDSGVNIDAVLAGETPNTETGTIYKFNLSYTPTDNSLFYATYSEGFRPGGFNRNGGISGIPFTFVSDEVANYEIGWKTTLLDGGLQFNGAAYFIDWNDMQTSIIDLSISTITFTDNVGAAEITGIEGDVIYEATDNLTLYGAFSYNDTELVEVPSSVVNIAPEGSELAFTPELQGTVRARYEWETQGYRAHFQVAGQYAGESFSSVVIADRFEQDSRFTLDGSIGISTGNWSAEISAENLTDERAELYINTHDATKRITTNRPRTVGLRFSYDF